MAGEPGPSQSIRSGKKRPHTPKSLVFPLIAIRKWKCIFGKIEKNPDIFLKTGTLDIGQILRIRESEEK